MSIAVRDWKPGFRYYPELLAVECNSKQDFEKIFNAMRSPQLRACPHDFQVGAFAVIVPKMARSLLPLREITCKEIALREVLYVGDEIQAELRCRFNEQDVKKRLPHYYVCGTGSHSMCIRAFVALKTVKEIQKQLRKK